MAPSRNHHGGLDKHQKKVGGLAEARQAEDEHCGNSYAKTTDSIGESGGCAQ
jgi:hypothetical protein